MKKIIILLFSLFLVSCGPVYTTKYKYTPPNTQSGRNCVNQCINNKSQCYNNCSNKYYVCTALDEIKFRKTYKKQKCNAFDMECNQEKMSASLKANICEEEKEDCQSQCGEIFNQCYSNCGGNVEAHQVCTSFCK